MTLRRGETLLLTLGIPVVFLLFFSKVSVVSTPTATPANFFVPGILALAVMSTAMVSLGIATGFERGYGVLKRLGATPLGRPRLLGAKIVTIVAVELLQAAVLLPVGLALGWNPGGGGPAAVAGAIGAVLLGSAAFAGIGLFMAGTLRAEVNLAAANGLYLILLLLGGMIVPISKLPERAGGLRQAAAGGGAVLGVARHPRSRRRGAGRVVGRPGGLGGGGAGGRRAHVQVGMTETNSVHLNNADGSPLPAPGDGWLTKRTVFALVAMGLAVITIANDFTAFSVAIPTMENQLHASLSTVQWVLNAYALVFGVAIVTGGRLADMFGRRRVFLIGTVIFAAVLAGVRPGARRADADHLPGTDGDRRRHDVAGHPRPHLRPPARVEGRPGRRARHRRRGAGQRHRPVGRRRADPGAQLALDLLRQPPHRRARRRRHLVDDPPRQGGGTRANASTTPASPP